MINLFLMLLNALMVQELIVLPDNKYFQRHCWVLSMGYAQAFTNNTC